MPEIINFISVFLVGAIASFFGSTIGGAGLISIPFLIFLGLPVHVAVATDRFGTIGGKGASLYKFWKAGEIVWSYVLSLSIISLVGALIGAQILVTLSADTLERLAGVMLLVLLPFVFLKKDIGVKRRETSKVQKAIGSFVFFLIQVFTGFFGAGAGPFVFYTLMAGFGLTIVESVATQLIPSLVLSITSLIIFIHKGIVDYRVGVVLLLGMIVGGDIGASFAIKKGAGWIKGLFVVGVIAASVKLLFF